MKIKLNNSSQINILFLAILICTFLSVVCFDFFEKSPESQTKNIKPFQPSSLKINLIEQTLSLTNSTVYEDVEFQKLNTEGLDVKFKGGLPYFKYYSLNKPSQYFIHPQNMGNLLALNIDHKYLRNISENILSLAEELPNGGIAWYYPRHYNVSRMKGDLLKYSSISQGSILKAFSLIEKKNSNTFKISSKIFLSLLWPFELGGTNLSNKAVLEMPSFNGPPEIILNGWLDSLLNIREYVHLSNDKKAQDFYKDNIKFLSEIIQNFDSDDKNTSLYSDTSPYKVKITVKHPEDINSIRIKYRPLINGLPNIDASIDQNTNSIKTAYENHIEFKGKNFLIAWISCSKLYETQIIATTDELQVYTNKGIFSPYQSTPGSKGEKLYFTGKNFGQKSKIVKMGSGDGLICGYPTNFVKGKGNFYHVYHIICLLLLTQDKTIEQNHKKIIKKWALKWWNDMNEIEKEKKLDFYDPDLILNKLYELHPSLEKLSFTELINAQI